MEEASQALDYEYAAVLRDRLDRLASLQRELVAFRGRVDGLSFVYRAPGFRGDTRLYLIRRGLVRAELPEPTGKAARRQVAREVGEVFSCPPPDPGALSQEAASEILLVARWFRLREREMDRVMTPEAWMNTYAPV
jgi:excinuclease ABC subunit C